MKNRQLFAILTKLWNRIFKQLTQFSLRFKNWRSKDVTQVLDADYRAFPSFNQEVKSLPDFIETDLFPQSTQTLLPERISSEEIISPEASTIQVLLPETTPSKEIIDAEVSTTQAIVEDKASSTPVSQPKKEIKKGPLRLAVDKIPLIDVAEYYGWLSRPKRDGANYLKCPLPQHAHSKASSKKRRKRGSFEINTFENTARCYKCNSFTYRDAASLLAAVRGEQKQWTATLILARDFKLITEETFEKAMNGGKVLPEEIQESTMFSEFKPVKIHRNPLNHINIDRVYRCLMMTYRVAAINKEETFGCLSKEDFNYLHITRKMSQESIQEGQYFSFPKTHQFETFLKILIHNQIITSVNELDTLLKGVPGFYYDCEKQSWTFKRKNGIGIPIKNADGLIVGIQIRNSDAGMERLRQKYPDEEPVRYDWFSSSWDVTNGRLHGSGPGTPIAVVKPKTLKSHVLFITEGYFKAQKIAETFGCIALSVQGVSTFAGIEVQIQKLIKQGYPIKHIYLAYDADLSYKPSVFKNSQATMALLAHHFPTLNLYYVGWDVRLGKGIDDLIEAGHQDRLSKLPQQTFEKICYICHEKMEQMNCEWEEDDFINFYNQHVLIHFPGYEKEKTA